MSIAEQAKEVYELRLKSELEAKHRGEFVAIEPISEAYFLAPEFIDAAMAAKNAYPERKSFILRIGHEAAFHIGGFAHLVTGPFTRPLARGLVREVDQTPAGIACG
jgi:hypothetical protein